MVGTSPTMTREVARPLTLALSRRGRGDKVRPRITAFDYYPNKFRTVRMKTRAPGAMMASGKS